MSPFQSSDKPISESADLLELDPSAVTLDWLQRSLEDARVQEGPFGGRSG